MKPSRLLPVLVLLAACGTPQEQCINRNTRDLRVVERLITETEGNLARGFAYEEYTVYLPDYRPCVRYVPGTEEDPTPRAVEMSCRVMEPETMRRPKAIDLGAERQKLNGLLAQQAKMSRAAEGVIAECRRLYPE